MASSFCCCSPCRPAYKKKVDAIYPEIPGSGLVKSEMDALAYYGMTSPEKLDRIGEYLAEKIRRDIARGGAKNKEVVYISLEAFDQLFSACHRRNINMFVESYLKTIQRLLESPDPDFQILASKSFSQFSQINEETPSYHRTYDFFIDRFSQMSHSNHPNPEIRDTLRIAGLRGIHGVVRKSVNEDLAENIWESKHMNLIIPSLLFNLETGRGPLMEGRVTPDLGDLDSNGGDQDESAWAMADKILREVVNSATSISIKAILMPVLRHIDEHHQWEADKQDFAVQTFEAIMYSIQGDLSYILIENIVHHIHEANNIKLKGNIATVLSKIIHIGVSEATVGPAVLEIITSLLKQLERAVEAGAGYSLEEQTNASSETMVQFQHALFRCLGEYTGNMPGFQKSENLSFILSKIPMDSSSGGREKNHSEIQRILMKALIAVAEKHTGTLFSSNFNAHLLRLLMANDQNVRLLVLQTFQILADRNANMEKLQVPTLAPQDLDLYGIPGRKNRSDHAFAQKTLFRIYAGFKQVLAEHNNSKDFLESMYTTVAILSIELSSTDEGIMYLLELIGGIQSTAVSSQSLRSENRFNLHSLAVLLLAILAMIVNIPDIDIHFDDVVKNRKAKSASHLLPPITETYNPGLDPNALVNEEEDSATVLINVDQVKEALKSAGKDVEQFGSSRLPTTFEPPSRLDYPGGSKGASRRSSTVSAASVMLEIGGADSNASSPGVARKGMGFDNDFKAFKRTLEAIPGQVKEEQANRKKNGYTNDVGQWYAMWDELAENPAAAAAKPDLQDLQEDLFNRLSFGEKIPNTDKLYHIQEDAENSDNEDHFISIMNDKAPFGRFFPEIYLY